MLRNSQNDFTVYFGVRNAAISWNRVVEGDFEESVSIDLVPVLLTLAGGPLPSGCSLDIIGVSPDGLRPSAQVVNGHAWFPLTPKLGEVLVQARPSSSCQIDDMSLTEADLRSGKIDLKKKVDPRVETKITVTINGQIPVDQLRMGVSWAPGILTTTFVNGSVVKITPGKSQVLTIDVGKDRWSLPPQFLQNRSENILDLRMARVKARVRSIFKNAFSGAGGTFEPLGVNLRGFLSFADAEITRPGGFGFGRAARPAADFTFTEFELPEGTYVFSSKGPVFGDYGCFIVPPVQ